MVRQVTFTCTHWDGPSLSSALHLDLLPREVTILAGKTVPAWVYLARVVQKIYLNSRAGKGSGPHKLRVEIFCFLSVFKQKFILSFCIKQVESHPNKHRRLWIWQSTMWIKMVLIITPCFNYYLTHYLYCPSTSLSFEWNIKGKLQLKIYAV